MKAVVLYRSNSEHARAVEEFAHEFERRTSKKLELQELDTREGADMAKLYDVTSYPAVLAMSEDGQLLKLWMGERMPLVDEVAGYVLQSS